MKKVIKLTESDLVKIVKRVIEEQITDKGPILPKDISKIEIDGDVLQQLNSNFKVDFKKEESPKNFIDKLNNSNIGLSSFYINSDGYRFPVQPVFVKLPIKSGYLKFSFEPFDQENGKYMFRLVRDF